MCLYPRLIKNKKYEPNKKNGGIPPKMEDPRTEYVPIGCGKCIECRKQRKRNWQIRLQEEIQHDRTGKFITLSFSDESLIELENDVKQMYPIIKGYDLDNEVATLAVRRFLERWRKQNGKSVKHWLVTELGQKSTERIHLHGILFTNDLQSIHDTWQYGNIWIGSYCSEITVNYIVKYVHKVDQNHKEYNPKVLVTPGIGKTYMSTPNSQINKYNGKDTKEYYKARNGAKIALPTYYRNKIYTEKERENLWINLIDKQIRYVNGTKIDVSKGIDEYFKVLEQERRNNIQLGFGNNKINWSRIYYENQLRELKRKLRHNKNGKYKRDIARNTEDDINNMDNINNLINSRMHTLQKDFESDKDDRDRNSKRTFAPPLMEEEPYILPQMLAAASLLRTEQGRRVRKEYNDLVNERWWIKQEEIPKQKPNPLVFRGEVNMETGEIQSETVRQGTIWKN